MVVAIDNDVGRCLWLKKGLKKLNGRSCPPLNNSAQLQACLKTTLTDGCPLTIATLEVLKSTLQCYEIISVEVNIFHVHLMAHQDNSRVALHLTDNTVRSLVLSAGDRTDPQSLEETLRSRAIFVPVQAVLISIKEKKLDLLENVRKFLVEAGVEQHFKITAPRQKNGALHTNGEGLRAGQQLEHLELGHPQIPIGKYKLPRSSNSY
jgi:hypothetical protein